MKALKLAFSLMTIAVLVGCASTSKPDNFDPKSQNGRYLAACKVGDGGACYALGNNIASGVDVEANRLHAHKYYVAACDIGNQDACKKQDEFIKDVANATVRALATE